MTTLINTSHNRCFMRCQKKGLTGAKEGLLAMSVFAVVIIVVAMECVWLLVCACAALEFSVLQRFVSLRVYLLASLPLVDSPTSVPLTPPGVRYFAWLSKGFELYT